MDKETLLIQISNQLVNNSNIEVIQSPPVRPKNQRYWLYPDNLVNITTLRVGFRDPIYTADNLNEATDKIMGSLDLTYRPKEFSEAREKWADFYLPKIIFEEIVGKKKVVATTSFELFDPNAFTDVNLKPQNLEEMNEEEFKRWIQIYIYPDATLLRLWEKFTTEFEPHLKNFYTPYGVTESGEWIDRTHIFSDLGNGSMSRQFVKEWRSGINLAEKYLPPQIQISKSIPLHQQRYMGTLVIHRG